MIDLTGLDKAEVLAALYNASRPFGMGYLHFDPTPMTRDEAQVIMDGRGDDATDMFGGAITPYFDYLKGRVMKVDLSGDALDTGGYNRENGENAAEDVVARLQRSKQQAA